MSKTELYSHKNLENTGLFAQLAPINMMHLTNLHSIVLSQVPFTHRKRTNSCLLCAYTQMRLLY